MKNLTKIEIIKETVEFYSEDINRRSASDSNGCRYNGDNGTHCAFGRCMLPKYQEQGEKLLSNDWKIETMLENNKIIFHDDVLQEKYRGHEISFWNKIQTFHDTDRFWGVNRLTSSGVLEFKKLNNLYI